MIDRIYKLVEYVSYSEEVEMFFWDVNKLKEYIISKPDSQFEVLEKIEYVVDRETEEITTKTSYIGIYDFDDEINLEDLDKEKNLDFQGRFMHYYKLYIYRHSDIDIDYLSIESAMQCPILKDKFTYGYDLYLNVLVFEDDGTVTKVVKPKLLNEECSNGLVISKVLR